jgi:hypothetical protein
MAHTHESVLVADAVVDALADAEFSMEIAPAREFLPRYKLTDLGTVHVPVVPRGAEYTPQSRGGVAREYRIEVGILRKLDSADAEEVAEMLALVDEIAMYFAQDRLLTGYQWVKTEQPELYSAEHLEQMKQFTTVLAFYFRCL